MSVSYALSFVKNSSAILYPCETKKHTKYTINITNTPFALIVNVWKWKRSGQFEVCHPGTGIPAIRSFFKVTEK